jgi:DNA repair photolyase
VAPEPHIEEITCKSALTGEGTEYRLNPYVGCEHACSYCYATFVSRWRNKDAPWGSWVQVKRNIVPVLQRQIGRKRGIHIFMATVCDVYQPTERTYCLTRECLEVLGQAALLDDKLRVFVLTKSDLILRDTDILQRFPEHSLEVAFSINTVRDEIARRFEQRTSLPSERFEAAQALKQAGLQVGILINPILPYFTEHDMPKLLERADQCGVDSVGFDTLNYLSSHVGGAVRPIYRRFGGEAMRRLELAQRDPAYRRQLMALIDSHARGRRFRFRLDRLGES